jgi:hypothetical protein
MIMKKMQKKYLGNIWAILVFIIKLKYPKALFVIFLQQFKVCYSICLIIYGNKYDI